MPPVMLRPAGASDVVVARARAALAIDPPIRYGLGHGGRRPERASPADPGGYCDCSGFAAWCLGIDRRTAAGVWLNTDELERDARAPGGLFDRIAAPRPGCLIVYGAGARIGHVGVVVAIDPVRVVHCAAQLPAIRESGPEAFLRHGAVYAWLRELGA